jgi:recombinational DNA repair protein (RecF pathway)
VNPAICSKCNQPADADDFTIANTGVCRECNTGRPAATMPTEHVVQETQARERDFVAQVMNNTGE